MSLNYCTVEDAVLSKDLKSFLQNYQGSVSDLFEILNEIDLCLADDNIRSKRDAYRYIYLFSLVPELTEEKENLEKMVETHFDKMQDEISFNEILNRTIRKRLISTACEHLKLSDLDHYDLTNKHDFPKRGKYSDRSRNHKLIKKFLDVYYRDDSDKEVNFIKSIEELKIMDQMDLYDILDDDWNCMNKEDMEKYLDYFKISDEISQHLLKRY